MAKKRSRIWCFTINNDSYDDLQMMMDNLDAQYFLFGFEVGELGTPHIQGYLQYKNSTVSRKKLKRILPRAHLEIAKGTFRQNYNYCTKDGDFYEFGVPPYTGQGERNDLKYLRNAIESGASIEEVAHNNFSEYLKYGKMMTQYAYMIQPHRQEKPRVEWVYGPTGIGKTQYAFAKTDDVYIKDHTIWWDGYCQQEVIVIDDYDGRWPFRDLLRLLDFYPYQGQVKGGYSKINSPLIIITCDRSIDELYEHISDEERAQLKRRIDAEINLSIFKK